MEKKKMSGCGMCMALIMGIALMVGMAEAQSVPSCAQKLIPCVDYMNATNPPSSCCTPLRETVATELTCLCNLYSTPGLLQQFGINVTQALQLSTRCGVKADLSHCNSSASPPSGTPPATRGGDNGGTGRVAFTGLSFLLLFWASMLSN